VIRLTTATLVRLRDRLRERGARASLPLQGVPASQDELLAALITAEYGPLCEVMYMMMAADGRIAGAERDVIRGAMRELDARIRSVHVEAMLSDAAAALEAEGREGRLQHLGATLGEDPARAEAAFQLAAAVAAADDVLAPEEKVLLRDLGGALGIPAARARQLFEALEKVDDLVTQDAGIDATDVLLHAAMRVGAPEDFERLAATSRREDVTLMLRLYAAFMRSGEDLRDKGDHAGEPRSISAARVAALEELVRCIPAEASPQAQALRVTLARLAVGLADADRAVALRPLADLSALATLEDALAGLAQVATNARRRCGETVADEPAAPSELTGAVARVIESDDAATRATLQRAIDACASRAERSVPPETANVVTRVVRRLASLPVDPPGTASPPSRDTGPPLPAWLPAKRTLGGFYVLSPLGGGAAGSVFVVMRSDERDEPGAERFALKVPQYDAGAARAMSEAEFLKMFREEAGALLSLPEHDNLARFITFDARAKPKPVLVMELVEGTPADALLEKRGLDARRALSILDGVLAGLVAMHEVGIGHLDLKPSNVIVRDSGQPVLVDFGLSGRHLRPGCATGAYGAPEVWGIVTAGPPATPLQADVYGFACVAFEMMTGRTLFDAPNEMACVAAHVSHDGLPEPVLRMTKDPRHAPLGNVLYHCLRRDSRMRPAAPALRAELSRIAPQLAGLAWPLV
jgi:tellurite resistance protein